MFGNTQVVPFDAVNKTLVKIDPGQYSSEYLLREAAAEYRMKIRHSIANIGGVKYDRHNVEIIQRLFATSTVPEFQRRAYCVFENLPGDADGELAIQGLTDWLDASSGANLLDLLGWQS